MHCKTITILLRIRVRGHFVMSISKNHEYYCHSIGQPSFSIIPHDRGKRPYLPMYNARPCIIHILILTSFFLKKKEEFTTKTIYQRFRENHSTLLAILDIVNTIQNNMDLKLFNCAVFIHLGKAFDTVDHSNESYSRSLIIIVWGQPLIIGFPHIWLTVHRLLMKKTLNETVINKISHEVPQGSVLEPVLSMAYIYQWYY